VTAGLLVASPALAVASLEVSTSESNTLEPLADLFSSMTVLGGAAAPMLLLAALSCGYALERRGLLDDAGGLKFDAFLRFFHLLMFSAVGYFAAVIIDVGPGTGEFDGIARYVGLGVGGLGGVLMALGATREPLSSGAKPPDEGSAGARGRG
jgi:hypothetical protein